MRRLLLAVVLVAGTSAGVAAPHALGGEDCVHPTLVLSAMPLELNPLVAAADLDPARTTTVDGRTFYVGRLAGTDVVLAMTGIGLVNAEQTATLAFEHFRCSFRAAMFSGVAGSVFDIGDVAVPARWTRDGGATFTTVDRRMLAVARDLDGTGAVALSRDVPVGDAACACPGVDAATPVHMPQPAAVHVGGDGTSADTFGDHAVPCLPGGGDIAGCAPCFVGSDIPGDAADFARNAPPLVDPGFVQGFLQPPDQTTDTYASQDEETAAVAQVAHRYRVPFLGVRAVSDGRNDPLHLPGFPFQFFVYRQLAGNNAAAVTTAFLRDWAARGRPVSRS